MDVFVYGTLTAPERVRELLDSFAYVGSATVIGLHLVEGRYPTLAPGGDAAGRLLRTDEVETLDEYEGVDDDLYVRVSIPLQAPDDAYPETVAVYVGDPDRLDAAATWPGEGSLGERVRSHVSAAGVRAYVDEPTPV